MAPITIPTATFFPASSWEVSLDDIPFSGVIGSEGKIQPVLKRALRLPGLPELTIIIDTGRDIPARLSPRAIDCRMFLSNLFEASWHDLHDPDGPDTGSCFRIQPRLSHRLGLEMPPIKSGTEIPFRILREIVVELFYPLVPVICSTGSRQHQDDRDDGDQLKLYTFTDKF